MNLNNIIKYLDHELIQFYSENINFGYFICNNCKIILDRYGENKWLRMHKLNNIWFYEITSYTTFCKEEIIKNIIE